MRSTKDLIGCCLRKNLSLEFCCVHAQQFFLLLSRICSRKVHFENFYRKNTSGWVCLQIDGQGPLEPTNRHRGRKFGKFSCFEIIWFLYFHMSAVNTPNREKTDVKEKNLFFFSFRKRKFKCNFFSIKCKLFTNFPLLHDFLSLN